MRAERLLNGDDFELGVVRVFLELRAEPTEERVISVADEDHDSGGPAGR